MLVLQEELNIARSNLADIQMLLTESQQSRSAAYAQINTLNSDIQKQQQTIEELRIQAENDDVIYALNTQVRIVCYIQIM